MNKEQDVREESRIETALSVGGKAYHLVYIKNVENGFIVTIGCKEFVATDWIEVSSKLGKYWDSPRKAEREFCK